MISLQMMFDTIQNILCRIQEYARAIIGLIWETSMHFVYLYTYQ